MSYNLTGATVSGTFQRIVQVVHGVTDTYYDGLGNLLDLGPGSYSVGPQGATGPRGATGSQGISVFWQGDWDAYQRYFYYDLVYYSGNSYICTLDLTGSAPWTSPDSDTAHWSIMAKGITGSNGSSGTSGTSGSSGISGSSGTSGIDGTSGSSGSSGTSGIDGASGSSGTSGIDGTSGTSGSSGTSGTSGSSGTAGSSGTSGSSGTAGSSGTSGTSGSSGTSGQSIPFYFQTGRPVPDPTILGSRWIDSDNGREYVWVYDGATYAWMQPTQLVSMKNSTNEIPYPTYSASFSFEYYGVIYMGGICTVTLPQGTSPDDDGKFIAIADEVGGVSKYNRGIVVQGTASQLINGQQSILMKIERMSLTFMYRNSSWKTI